MIELIHFEINEKEISKQNCLLALKNIFGFFKEYFFGVCIFKMTFGILHFDTFKISTFVLENNF